MGIFNTLGRKAERFRREVADATADEATHECAACGALIYADRDVCPDCGSDEVVTR
ncbi:MAG: zinc ribbon domain-containing protein [Haloferacaceae archaeon]